MTGKAPSKQLSSIEFLTVKTHLGMDMNAWMMKPPDFDAARKYPVILYVAGGPGEQIVREAWGGDISLWLALMAQNGYIVFAVDNRGSAGRGHLFEEPVHLRLSAAEMADLRDKVLYLRSQPWMDKTRIGICGWAYGGFLALHGMLDRPLLFKAGFAGSPITDWHLYDAVFAERYLEDPKRNQDGWLNSSPLENAKNLSAPLLLAQATLDETVHQENSLMLLDELLDNGKYADILLFPDRRDLFEDHGARLILFQRAHRLFSSRICEERGGFPAGFAPCLTWKRASPHPTECRGRSSGKHATQHKAHQLDFVNCLVKDRIDGVKGNDFGTPATQGENDAAGCHRCASSAAKIVKGQSHTGDRSHTQ